jgi:hypothetical protein
MPALTGHPQRATAWARRSPASLRAGKVTRVNPNDEELATLREKHPGWQIWRVDRYLGGPLWCARPLGQTQPVLNAPRPGRLSELIDAQEAGLAATGPAPERNRRAGGEPALLTFTGHQGAGSQDSAADREASAPYPNSRPRAGAGASA